MTRGGEADDNRISDEVRMLATAAIERAADAPDEERIAALAGEALAKPGTEMTATEIRAMAATALDQAHQLSHLLTRLASLLDDPGERDEQQG